ncbi:MAG: single-stranded-DNA-specific exonuclease RecJ, partial [Clostridia bacterium]|nr:single-stranded-DNA-specific exonuclease RecJ [Clostridia bacterium]
MMIGMYKNSIKNRWDIKYQDSSVTNRIAVYLRERFFNRRLGERKIQILSKLLYNRKITTKQELDDFFNMSLSRISDPYLLPDMKKAVNRIKLAVANKEKITVYGDYDVDGITSVTILYKYLKSCGCPVDFYIPDRTEEGYGLNCNAIQKIKENGTDLLITVDTGTTASEELLYANKINLDVIVTDHHECKQIQKKGESPCDMIPSAIAVINPKRMSSSYPFSELAGVGVVFLLISVLMGNIEKAFELYGIYTAIGTIADIMPLTGENRIIVTNGLDLMKRRCPIGIRALINETDSNKTISASLVAFQIAPRLNAAGRIGDPKHSVELLLSEDFNEAKVIAKELCESNRMRQQMEQDILNEAEKMMKDQFVSDKIIVLHSGNWHHGVIGIVASRLTEKYKRPCILLCKEGEHYKGSGRSVPGVNIFELLCKVSDTLLKFGGHEMAAGLTLEESKINAFSVKLAEEAERAITQNMLTPVIEAECELNYEDVDSDLMGALKLLEPYGTSNPLPVFLIRDMFVSDVDNVGSGKHSRFQLSKVGSAYSALSAISFNNTNEDLNCVKHDFVDLMCTVSENNFNSKTYISLQVKDINLNP